MPCSLRNRSRCSRGIRRSCEPGIRYPRKRPESNHLLTVRGATLQIFATWPVVNTFFIIEDSTRPSLVRDLGGFLTPPLTHVGAVTPPARRRGSPNVAGLRRPSRQSWIAL